MLVSTADSSPWWRGAAIYQVYPRSFADGNGDGIGDLAGIRAHLPYLAELGVDAIWFNPWYPSPMADAGYDVADYRDIDPVFGTLAEAEELIARGARAGHPDHRRHRAQPLLRRAPLVPGGAGRRARRARAGPVLVPARPRRARRAAAQQLAVASSAARPGPAPRTRTARPASGTCTCSPRSSPTSTGTTPQVREEFEDVLRFWFDRGVDGVRIDSAGAAGQGPGRCPTSTDDRRRRTRTTTATRCTTSTGRWRRIADSYAGAGR